MALPVVSAKSASKGFLRISRSTDVNGPHDVLQTLVTVTGSIYEIWNNTIKVFEITANGGTSLNHVHFAITPIVPTPHTEGTVYWNSEDHTLNMMSEISGSVLQLGQENWLRIVNKTGSQLNDGQVVYISGAQGNRPTAALAIATSTNSDKTIGVMTNNVANNAEGYVATFGIVRGYNTSGFADGDELWVDPTTPGALTNVRPVAPNHAVRVGYALNSTNNGSIFVNPHTGAELSQLHDVLVTTPANKDALRYISASNRWENTAQGAWLDTAQTFSALQTFSSGLTVSSGTTALQAASCTTLTASGLATAQRLSLSSNSGSYTASITNADATTANGLYIQAGRTTDNALLIRNAADSVNLMRVEGSGAATFSAGVTCTTLTASGHIIEAGSDANSTKVRGASGDLSLWQHAGSTGTSLGYVGFVGIDSFAVVNAAGTLTPLTINTSTGAATFSSGISCTTLTTTTATPYLTLDRTTASNASIIYYRDTTATKYNWITAAQYNTDNGWEVAASTTAGGGTYTETILACQFDGTRKVGFFGVAPAARQTIGAAATDAATTQTLANNIRTALINLGLCQD